MKIRFVLASLCLAFAATLGAAETPVEAARKWYAAMLKGDFETANALSADEQTRQQNKDDVELMAEIRKKADTDAKHRDILNKLENATFSEDAVDGDRAAVKITFPGAGTPPDRIKLRKVDGKWLVTCDEGDAKPKEGAVSPAELVGVEAAARRWWLAILNEDKKTADLFVASPESNAFLIEYLHELKKKAPGDAEARKELEDIRKARFGKAAELGEWIVVPANKDGELFFKVLFKKQDGKWLIVTIN